MSPPQGARGRGRERGGEGGSEGGRGGEAHVILGFRVPTTCDGKKFDDIIEWLGVPTTGSEGVRQGARGQGGEGGRGGEAHVILGFRVPTTCDGKKFDDIIEWLGVPPQGARGRGRERGGEGARAC